jgi:hypothetical protein
MAVHPKSTIGAAVNVGYPFPDSPAAGKSILCRIVLRPRAAEHGLPNAAQCASGTA